MSADPKALVPVVASILANKRRALLAPDCTGFTFQLSRLSPSPVANFDRRFLV
jgi:hypothetical protein